MTIEQYIDRINTRYRTGISREHSYRGDLQTLLESLCTDVLVTNEPARVACGAPDYILTRRNFPVGYIEAKDIGEELSGKKHKEQFERYRTALPNLIITDYLDFRLYRDGEFTTSIRIASIENGQVRGDQAKFEAFANLVRDFSLHVAQTIRSPKKLAEMMAGKARMLANVIENALQADGETENELHEPANNTLREQLEAFREILIHDIQAKEFADIYAQTIAYGMFAARLHDPSLDNFSRMEAAELIPQTNPFLRKLFQYIAGYDLDNRIKWIVDALADIFRATDVASLLKNFGQATRQHDPIIHFYETFLAEYDPKLRKARGVWYTPEPVVNFIVRAVDDVLKTEFDLPEGLADISKTKIRTRQYTKATSDQRSKLKEVESETEVHKVQILDPATGTGTFLAEVVRHIHQKFEGQQGIWSNYVDNHLLPRLNGFEILMASYAMAHLKLDLLLTETGYRPQRPQRLRVYLTNSLEEHHPDTGTLFANWLSTEANEANHIKRDTPVMVVLGNPPYSGESQNKGKWVMDLMEDYKKEPGGREKLKEQNSKFINDDYVKFMRYGQHFIEKNGEGILAFINPHGFLDNPTFRGMRWHLLKTYDKIYTIDLHGNTKKKETCPDGSPDVNVFDIEQGVSINILVKTGIKKLTDLGQLYHYDLFGNREFKYEFLISNSLSTVKFSNFAPFKPSFLFKNIDESKFLGYNEGINPVDLFRINVMGFQTHRDSFAVDFDAIEIELRARDLLSKEMSNEEICKKYGIKDNRDWNLKNARTTIQHDRDWKDKIIKCGYRPFDDRPCYFSYVMMDYPRKELIQNVLNRDNILLGIGRQGLAVGDIEWCLTTVSKYPVDANIFRRGGVNLFPLYLYPETNELSTLHQTSERIPNLNPEIVRQIAEGLGMEFTPEKEVREKTFAPIDLLDYIYAVLHSPGYREKYKEFLKIDFLRVPYPRDQEQFWALVALGGELRKTHLLESPKVGSYITQYPIDGDNAVGKPKYFPIPADPKTGILRGNVFINDTQYFANVPLKAWKFYIGGYQPAQKWLKDRHGRTLGFEDIRHYQKIIAALCETDRLMGEVDGVMGEE